MSAVSCTQCLTRATILSRCLIHVQWVFLADQQSRALALMIPGPGPRSGSLGKCLEKAAVLLQRHSENIRALVSPAPSTKGVSKAARANHCKEFFLKHRKTQESSEMSPNGKAAVKHSSCGWNRELLLPSPSHEDSLSWPCQTRPGSK